MQNEDGVLIQMAKDIAETTAIAKNIDRQLLSLNGKVAAHESRLQSLEGTYAITAQSVAKLNEHTSTIRTTTWRIVEKSLWAIIGVVSIGLYNLFIYLIKSGILKDIIK